MAARNGGKKLRTPNCITPRPRVTRSYLVSARGKLGRRRKKRKESASTLNFRGRKQVNMELMHGRD